MQLTIGANRVRNTDGVINVRGKRQILLEWGPYEAELLLTMDVYGAEGRHIARLRRNHWTFNDQDRFKFAAKPRGFSLVDTKMSQVVLEARVAAGNAVVITDGSFYNSAGKQIEVNVEDWRGTAGPATVASTTTKLTSPPFAAGEIAAIRKAMTSFQETIMCPRCGGTLTKERMPDAAKPETFLVSCETCRCNLVVRRGSAAPARSGTRPAGAT
jgi:hypothetical protein